MVKVFQKFFFLLSLTGTAFLLMGSDYQVKSVVTSSITGSAITSVTSSLTCSMSMVSRATNSLTSRPICSGTGGVMSKPTGSCVSSKPTPTMGAAGAVKKTTAVEVTLSPAAEELARTINFDRRVLLIVREESQDRISRLIGFDDDGYQIVAPGIAVSVPEDRSDRILESLRHKLRPLKYMPFVVEMNEGLKIDKIGVLKGTDQYAILRIMHTDGEDYEIANEDVIDRLMEWQKTSPFDIIGAGSDWVEIEFKTLPKDLNAFADEVYDFCPDTVDQGPASIEGLIKEIRRTNRLFLWWD